MIRPRRSPSRTDRARAPLVAGSLAAAIALACSPSRPDLDLTIPEPLEDRITVTIRVDANDALWLELGAQGTRAGELDVGLYAVTLDAEGSLRVETAAVRRMARRPFEPARALVLPLPPAERYRLSIDPIDPVSGYPDPDWTYLPQRGPERPLQGAETAWRAVWDLRARGDGLWLRRDDRNDRLELWLDTSRIERFLQE